MLLCLQPHNTPCSRTSAALSTCKVPIGQLSPYVTLDFCFCLLLLLLLLVLQVVLQPGECGPQQQRRRDWSAAARDWPAQSLQLIQRCQHQHVMRRYGVRLN
jgi:hypothetical protein